MLINLFIITFILLVIYCVWQNNKIIKIINKRGTFFRLQIYERVGISLVEVYEKEGKYVIAVCEKAPKRAILTIVYHVIQGGSNF